MKKIFTILTLLVLTGNYLTAAVMYEADPVHSAQILMLPSDFSVDDAQYTVGVTIQAFTEDNMTKWEIPDAQLNPVIKLPQAFLDNLETSPAGIAPDQAFAKYQTNGNGSFYSRMKEVTNPALKYTGKPLFMQFESHASYSADYKGETFQNGEVFSRFFPILDPVKFNSEGAFFETWYRKSSEMNWTKCETIESGPNGAVSSESEVWDDLNDHYPVEITWDAKTDLPNFDDEIVIRVRAKYGTEAFLTAPTSTLGDGGTSGDGNSTYPGDGGTSGDGNSTYPGDGNSTYPGDGNSSNP
ncbi:hypothetical protein N9408_09115 [Opitutales bacterium]|nr:hypothetical protein [Opitutales bacterium]